MRWCRARGLPFQLGDDGKTLIFTDPVAIVRFTAEFVREDRVMGERLAKALESITVNDIIGVQPMTAPSDLVHSMKYRYGK